MKIFTTLLAFLLLSLLAFADPTAPSDPIPPEIPETVPEVPEVAPETPEIPETVPEVQPIPQVKPQPTPVVPRPKLPTVKPQPTPVVPSPKVPTVKPPTTPTVPRPKLPTVKPQPAPVVPNPKTAKSTKTPTGKTPQEPAAPALPLIPEVVPESETILPPMDTSSIESSTPPPTESLYVLAQPTTHITPFGGIRMTFLQGESAFDSPFGGRPGTGLDLQNDMFVDTMQWGQYFGIDAQHSYFHISLAYGVNKSEARGNIPREVLIADAFLQAGAEINTNIDIHWFTGSLGYTVFARDWGGIGVKLSFNYIDIRTSINVDGYLADDPTNPRVNIKLDNSLFIPMPTIGAYLDWAFSDRLLIRTDFDFIFYDITNRQLTGLDFNIETRYYLVATQKFYGYFRFQYEYFNYDFNISKYRGNYNWHSLVFLIGAGTNF